MKHVLFVGEDPAKVDFSDPSLQPGLTTEKIKAGIDLAMSRIAEHRWNGVACMISPDDAGIAMLEKQLASDRYDCVVIGAGLRIPPKSLLLFEKVVNAVHRAAPQCAIAFNAQPEDTADAAARWVAPG